VQRRSHARAESPPIVFREACSPLLGWTTRANALNPRWRSSINRSMTNRKREFSRAVGASVITPVRARASWGLTGITMIDYAAVVSYLRHRPRRKDRPVCGAKTRAGRPCRMRVEFGKARCRLHGGLSTGPKTEAGRARIAEAQRRRWRDYREKRLGTTLADASLVKA
jgi:hypothetical protein